MYPPMYVMYPPMYVMYAAAHTPDICHHLCPFHHGYLITSSFMFIPALLDLSAAPLRFRLPTFPRSAAASAVRLPARPLPAYRCLFLIMTYVHLWTLSDSISYSLHVHFRLFACTSLPTHI